MEMPKLYRNRLIPKESILLDHDTILYQNDTLLITKWKTLKPKAAFSGGYSCYFLKEGYKISRFYNSQGQFLYWYCDIIDTIYHEPENTFIFTDLLADIIIFPEGDIRILDLDELADAHRDGLLSTELLHCALHRLHQLLQLLYHQQLEPITHTFMTIVSADQNSNVSFLNQ